MTRAEAVWHANHVFNLVIERCINAQNLKDAREFDEAKQIVIEALQQEPSEDCISRQDAIDALMRSSVYAWSTEEDQIAHEWALNIISKLPAKE